MDPSGGTVEAEWRHFTDVVEAVEAVAQVEEVAVAQLVEPV